jgi:hypothetical protein
VNVQKVGARSKYASAVTYGLCIEEKDLHPRGVGEHLVDVEL